MIVVGIVWLWCAIAIEIYVNKSVMNFDRYIGLFLEYTRDQMLAVEREGLSRNISLDCIVKCQGNYIWGLCESYWFCVDTYDYS